MKNENKISIIGGGVFGLAIYYRLRKQNVYLYDRNKNKEIIKQDFKKIYNVKLENLNFVSNSFNECLDNTNIIFVVIPSNSVEGFLDEFKKIDFDKKPIIVFLSKGFIFYKDKINVISQIVNLKLNDYDKNKLFYMAGPTIHLDVFENNKNYYFNISSFGKTNGNENINKVIELFPKNKVISNEDLFGLEFVCAIKNIFSIYFNYKKEIDENFDENSEIINCINEMKKLGSLFGEIQKETIINVGYDDLLITIKKGRNGILGKQLGKGEVIPNGINTRIMNTNYVPEGVFVLEKLYEMFKDKNDDEIFKDLKITKMLLEKLNFYK
jgi:glycerol-3-phosphate dehydrogenase